MLKLPAPLVSHGSWEEMRTEVQRNLVALAESAIDTGGRRLAVRAGTSSVTFTGGVVASATTTVTHGLGGTPAAVLLSPASVGSAWTPEWGGVGSTTFAVVGYGNAALAGAVSFSWVVFG